ncbi:EF-hand domain-containing protein [Marinobacter fonticola]|uniref:EF-hand domain-containing protein n=1 Tax=Marinobacter fonticola TaxID=2603215 RepID=UPI0011E80FD5|nr:EF-hand domain-containing protein [Marinobacter fonticola]
MLKVIVTAVVVSAFCVPGAWAQSGDSSPRDHFQTLDKDGDGALNEEELSAFGAPSAGSQTGNEESDRGQRVMNMYDNNGDGEVTPDEFDDPREGQRQWQCTDCPTGVEKREKVRDQMDDS